jgi:chromosome segregation ATPase
MPQAREGEANKLTWWIVGALFAALMAITGWWARDVQTRLQDTNASLSRRLDGLEQSVGQRVEGLNQSNQLRAEKQIETATKLSGLEPRTTAMEGQLSQLGPRIPLVEARISGLDARLQRIEEKLDRLISIKGGGH